MLRSPTVTVTGNTLFDLGCLDNESSFTGDASGISGNTGGQVACNRQTRLRITVVIFVVIIETAWASVISTTSILAPLDPDR